MKYKEVVIGFLLVVSICNLTAQTPAHEKSRFAIVDPMYNAIKQMPASNLKNSGPTWIYGPSELECWRLQVLQERKDSARLLVDYPGTFHKAYTKGSFRMKLNNSKISNAIHFRAFGRGQVFVNDKLRSKFNDNDSIKSIPLLQNESINEVRFDLSTLAGPPALLIQNGPFSTANPLWEWNVGTENWQAAFHHLQTMSGIPPHVLEDPEVVLKPVKKTGNLYDFGKELFGYVSIQNRTRPKVSVGESTYEALDTLNKVMEQSPEMVQTGYGLWKSKSLLAFRYLVTDVKMENIQCNAIFYPVSYKGAFACSDSMLTRIWMNSAYTLRLCMHDFLIDGIKRDRLPWTGDLAMSMMANAFTFDDPEIVRRSLTVLGRAGIKETDINGIIDYSLWWIIAQDHYQLYFGDKAHLQQAWPRIKETLDLLSARCDKSGFLVPGDKWLFIDWVKQEKWTALQVLWWWAQQCGSKLADRVGDTKTAIHMQNVSHSLKSELTKVAWNADKGIWLGNPEFPEKLSRHANLLAVISGLTIKNQFDGIHKLLENNAINPVGTPYMAGFENMAISQTGDIQTMMNRVKEYWGGMLNKGATTFWEAYDTTQKGKEQYSFYDRPYAKSLCHAWAAGPAAFLPAEIFGLHPTKDGWKQFTVNPDLGSLKWAKATIPTPFGNILIDAKQREMTVTIPSGTIADWKGEKITGPKVIHKVW